MKSMTKNISRFAALTVTSMVLFGCNGGSENASGEAAQGVAGSDSSGDALVQSKVYLEKASFDDVGDHLAECHGKAKNQICVQICHRPPGNPDNSKDMVLPLQAISAHLNHGGPNHDHKDYLGFCDEDDGSGGGEDTGGGSDTGGGDDGSTSGGGDEGSTTGSGEEEPEIPEWCKLHYDVDNNCDGRDDVTGESLY